ncbi:uncharacterized protein [Littorina saxatilis]|uniref:Activation-induced cytidine deaminase AID domain-containing protein n=1 Tax=Littorina saxatilis TaxID=31220 RepID=A0AAN9BY02_9CAEN
MSYRPRGGGYADQRSQGGRGGQGSFAFRNQEFPNGFRFQPSCPTQQEHFQRPYLGNPRPQWRPWVENAGQPRVPQSYSQFDSPYLQQDARNPDWLRIGPGNPDWQQIGPGNLEWQQNGIPNPSGTPHSMSAMEQESALPLSLSAPTNLERYKLFEILLTCGVETYGKKYLAIYWLHFGSEEGETMLHSPLFENASSLHAEEALLKYLRNQLPVTKRETLKSIIIMQNASPCSGCAKGYREELKTLVDSGVEVSVVFSSFHWIRRLSCRHQGHRHRLVPIYSHEQNIEGLQKLRDAGIAVRTTQYEDWRRLCSALQVPPPDYLCAQEHYHSSARGQEDTSVHYDLEHILTG